MSNQKINKLIAEIKDLKVSELLEVVRGLTTSEQSSPEKPEKPEKTEYTVILIDGGERKIEVIKVIRELAGLGLKEAKTLVDTAPSVVQEKISRRDADGFVRQLKDAGASVKLQ